MLNADLPPFCAGQSCGHELIGRMLHTTDVACRRSIADHSPATGVLHDSVSALPLLTALKPHQVLSEQAACKHTAV